MHRVHFGCSVSDCFCTFSLLHTSAIPIVLVTEGKPIEIDEKQLGQWLETAYPLVLQAVQRLGLSRTQAEDVVQDALIGLLDGIRKFKSYEMFVAYLRTSARWRALDSWRRRVREPTPESQLSEADRIRYMEHADSDQTDSIVYRRELEQKIEELPKRSRDVVTLTISGLDSFEIAKKLGVKPASVRSLLRFARYRLAKRID